MVISIFHSWQNQAAKPGGGLEPQFPILRRFWNKFRM